MTRFKIIPAALAFGLLATAAMPAMAVSIRHSNRAGGDPEAASAPTGHAAPPADTTQAHALDKLHDNGSVH
ncbi:hypothetical protein [Lichenibacterium ramalinae]|uniref:DUF680 domain-containing protein n=1 Tax=Lichenibacterium ramalinae TaxID=2316527 RepID=A0A4Q2RDZ4_9HYPH|nr:hypothetical protein [Lichenibacterium ramalinae]RYB04714.1 hypothetical protein D3272_12280 [Lichenibacterium ramalinae]